MSDIKIILGDCEQELKSFKEDSIDLIVTSPPYGAKRAKTYGGVNFDEYVAWFLPISKELLRVLKPTGTFILNIKESVVDGERHTYVLELILALRKQGWLWTEEFIWNKTNPMPGLWKNRFKDAWERLLQFNKTKTFNMYQDEMKVPNINPGRKEPDVRRGSKNGSGFGINNHNARGREKICPSNVLHLPLVGRATGHSAAFPDSIPEWFIKLFTVPGGLVLDPFSGSGTTVKVAEKLGRNAIAIEIKPEYIELHGAKPTLKELCEGIKYGK